MKMAVETVNAAIIAINNLSVVFIMFKFVK